jgi:hypothetical protein
VTQCGDYYLIPRRLNALIRRKILDSAVDVVLEALPMHMACDRTTSEKRGLSPKIILGDSRRSENAQTHTNKHTRPNMKFKLKLL